MIHISIVSTDPAFSRLLEIEIARSGFSYTLTSPAENCSLCLWDADHTDQNPLPSTATLIVFSEKEKDHLPKALSERAHLFFKKPFLLLEFRRALHELFHLSAAPCGSRESILPPKEPPRTRARKIAVTVEPRNKTVTVGKSAPVRLSDTEFVLFCRLNEHRGTPLSADDVADIIGATSSNKYNVYICYLRRKLESGNLRLIRTVRGKGYMLDF